MADQGSASAPGSAANLGPGFDCLAVALDLRCRVTATRTEVWSIHHDGDERPDVDSDDAVLRAARMAVGDRPLRLCVSNDIPIGRGLGSSAAAGAAGALAAWRAVGEAPSIERLYDLVCRLEGHPDNAAGAVLGGLVLVDPAGQPIRLPWNPLLHVVVAVPEHPLSTAAAREVLPAAYPAEVAVRSVARMGALVAGLLTADPRLLAAAAGDELHESHRDRLRRESAGLITAARSAGAFHASWSGAGPSVLALAPAEAVASVVAALEARLAGAGTVLSPAVATEGAI